MLDPHRSRGCGRGRNDRSLRQTGGPPGTRWSKPWCNAGDMASSHSIRAAALVAAIATTIGAQENRLRTEPSTFLVFLRAAPVGSELIAVSRDADGWTIKSSGQMSPPLDLVTKSLEVRYDPEWKPRELKLDAIVRGQPFGLQITVAGSTATTHVESPPQPSDRTDSIDPSAVLLPNPFFGAYEAVAARLKTAAPGSTIPVYQGGPMPITIRVGESEVERIQTVTRLVVTRRTHVTFGGIGATDFEGDIWGDENGRLLRVSIPAQAIEFVRDDIAAVSTRRVVISRPGDEQLRMPANGFTLAGTLSKPDGVGGKRLPAAVLIGGSGPTDRDETVAGIPVLGQLAGGLADAGFLVVRYDKRGIGQSGGRIETAGLAEFAEDLRAAVKVVASRKDVDPERIIAIGHSEGGAVTLLAAAKDRRIAGVVLLATNGVTGSELVLAQQQHLLDRSNLSESDKLAKIDLQKRIHDAVITGKGWEALPADIRRQVDTAEFQSVLTFDPAKVLPHVRQPLLIVHGMLDTQVDPSNADRLEALASARKRPAAVEVARIPGLNHLLVPATTGEVSEYTSLTEKQISPQVPSTITAWFQKTFAKKS
ncbi:MAG: hypothetical protein C5B57_00835 [Blastocatellia bacterium]|nr:MAG: hypothetical protein C5B57_00835 [Blastocatellia bacterium]